LIVCCDWCLQLKNGEKIDTNVTLKDLKSGQHITRVQIDQLFLLMGRELESLDSAPAGNVVGKFEIFPAYV
jgi:translation elongation factor EF-G